MRIRSLAAAIATGIIATTMLAMPVAAGASGGTIWVAHGIPGATVDVCVGGNAVKRDLQFGQKFKATLPAGSYTIRVRAAAHEDCKGAVVIKQTVGVTNGLNATAIAVVKAGTPKLAIYVNDISAPGFAAAEPATLTVIHEAKAPAVDVWLLKTVRLAGGPADSPTLSDLLRGGQAGPVALETDVYAFWAALPGSTDPVIGPAIHTFRPGIAYTVIAVGTNLSNYRFIAFGQPQLDV